MSRAYRSTPAGRIDATRDIWDEKLSAQRHAMTWSCGARHTDRPYYIGECENCHGRIEIGDQQATFLAGVPPFEKADLVTRCKGREQ